MKKMSWIAILLIAFFAISSSSYAQPTLNTEGLSDTQRAELALQIEQMKDRSGQSQQDTLTPEKVNEWADLGKNIALAFITVASELGVAADTFLESTTGKVTLALIVWKVAGESILGFIVGTGFFFTFLPLWIYFFRRLCLIKGISYERPEGGGRWKKKIYEHYDGDESEIVATRWVMLVVLVLVTITSLAVAL